MNGLPLVLQVLSGVASGYIAGARFSDLSLGRLGDSAAGLAGGWIAGELIQDVWTTMGANFSDLQIFLTSVGGGGVGGAIMMVVVGLVKLALHRK